jgi:hypothetical protein
VTRWSFPVLLTLAACGGGREVRIEAAIPGPDSVDAPVAHLGFVALPYDRDSVLQALEARNPRPAAITRQLDSLFQEFRGPFILYAADAYRAQDFEQQVGRLRRQLDSLPRSSPAYDSLYRAFGVAADSLEAARRRRDKTQHRLAVVRNDLSPRIDSLRRIMGRWEDSTYRGYDSITRVLGSRFGRESFRDSTGADGTAVIRLARGDWWIYARSWDAWDPNSEWYWNVKVTGDRVVLDRASGRRMPRS